MQEELLQASSHPRAFVENAVSRLTFVPRWLVDAIAFDLSFQDPEANPTPAWDGWWRLMDEHGLFPTGLLPNVVRLARKYGFNVEVKDKREPPVDEVPLMQLAQTFARRGHALRDYQIALAQRALYMGRGVIVSAPRSGKTTIGEYIYDLNPQPTLWIAPTKAIVRQTARVIERDLPGTSCMTLLGGGSMFQKMNDRRKAESAHIVLTTAATAVKLTEQFYRTRRMLIIDEFHHAASRMYQQINLLAKDIYYRFGLTGTHFRSDENTEILMNAVLSDVVGKTDLSMLIARGYIVPARVLFVPIETPRVFAGDHDEAYRFGVMHHETRNAWVVWAARALVAAGRRTIVLVKLKDHGEKLAKLMPESTYVNGDDSDGVERGIAAFNAGKIPILIGTSVLGEGVDLPAADALVYAKGGKAAVQTTQDFYRVLTAIVGKREGIVIDFADRTHPILMRHALARAKLYAAHQDFNVDVLTAGTIQHFAQMVAL